MNSRRKAELRRRLSIHEVPTPPAGLAGRLKDRIPERFESREGRQSDRKGGGALPLRIAASLLLLAFLGYAALRVLRFDRASAPLATASAPRTEAPLAVATPPPPPPAAKVADAEAASRIAADRPALRNEAIPTIEPAEAPQQQAALNAAARPPAEARQSAAAKVESNRAADGVVGGVEGGVVGGVSGGVPATAESSAPAGSAEKSASAGMVAEQAPATAVQQAAAAPSAPAPSRAFSDAKAVAGQSAEAERCPRFAAALKPIGDGKLLRLPQLVRYPEVAAPGGAAGDGPAYVDLQISAAGVGRVLAVSGVRSGSALDAAAKELVERATFYPAATDDGAPVAVRWRVAVSVDAAKGQLRICLPEP